MSVLSGRPISIVTDNLFRYTTGTVQSVALAPVSMWRRGGLGRVCVADIQM